MDFNQQIKKSYGNEPYDSWFAFAMPGGATNPLMSSLRGPMKGLVVSMTRTAAGAYSIVLLAGFTPGGEIAFSYDYVPSALANNRAVMSIQTAGNFGYAPATRTLTLQVATLANPGVGDDGATTDNVVVRFDATNVTVSPTGGT